MAMNGYSSWEAYRAARMSFGLAFMAQADWEALWAKPVVSAGYLGLDAPKPQYQPEPRWC